MSKSPQAATVTASGEQSRRGRDARQPSEIPARGWRDIVLRIKDRLIQDNLSVVAAGVAFFSLLSVFPGLAALVAVYGLVAEPGQAQEHIAYVSVVLPAAARAVLDDQLRTLVRASETTLSVTLFGGLLFMLVSAMRGTKALMFSLNIAYEESENRNFFVFNLSAFLLTLGALVFGVVALSLVVAVPALMGLVNLPEVLRGFVDYARWPLLGAAVMTGLMVMYRFGPSRAEPRWKWASWGAVTATLLWLAASGLFSVYVANFGNYNEMYGSVGAVVILLMWFFISAYAVLLGAELNAEMEHQTKVDTTSGPDKPMGERDAYVADHLGRTP